jgi:hypothetical protein
LKTWTERIEGITPRQVLTLRAGAEVSASVADEYGVASDTAWAAVVLPRPQPARRHRHLRVASTSRAGRPKQ